MPVIGPADITGLVLAGGRGTRMGGVDKGLQLFRGAPLALHALVRLQSQQGQLVGPLMVNANRNQPAYAAFGHPVWPDTLPGHAGPLAGLLTGMVHCTTPWLLVVPCDSPQFPLSLARRLAEAFDDPTLDIATVAAREGDPDLRLQPVFSLLRVQDKLQQHLRAFLASGQRRAEHWIQQQQHRVVAFDHPDDDPQAFFNANTLAELQSLEGD